MGTYEEFLYLQWLKTDDENKKVVELITIPIPEFNTGDWSVVQEIEYQNNGLYILHKARPGRNE
jgi:hypothetical protein